MPNVNDLNVVASNSLGQNFSLMYFFKLRIRKLWTKLREETRLVYLYGLHYVKTRKRVPIKIHQLICEKSLDLFFSWSFL